MQLHFPSPRTWPSLILRRLGDLLIAPPAALGVPPALAADFYAAPVDRHQPTKSEAHDIMGVWRPRIAVDALRRDLARHVAPLAVAFIAAAMLITVAIASGGVRLHAAWHAHDLRVAAAAQTRAVQASMIQLIPPPGSTIMQVSAASPTRGGVWSSSDCSALSYPLAAGYRVPQAAAVKVAACNLPPVMFMP